MDKKKKDWETPKVEELDTEETNCDCSNCKKKYHCANYKLDS